MPTLSHLSSKPADQRAGEYAVHPRRLDIADKGNARVMGTANEALQGAAEGPATPKASFLQELPGAFDSTTGGTLERLAP